MSTKWVRFPSDGSPNPLRLEEVARIEEGYTDRTGYTRLNGHEVITLHLFKEAGANTVQTSEKVYGDIYRFSLDYPDFEVRPVFDQADFIRESIDNVLQSLYLGGFFAFISLVLFLRDFRNPVIVGVSIPVSIIATFIGMYFLDIHFNVISLGGLALGIGYWSTIPSSSWRTSFATGSFTSTLGRRLSAVPATWVWRLPLRR